MQMAANSIEPEQSLPCIERASDAPADPLPEVPPRRVGGYRLAEHLARGGMADVYLALDDGGRLAVVKQVVERLKSVVRYDELLVGEGELATLVRHPNIVRALESGRDEHGAPYIAFEYVEGVDLRQVLRICTRRKIPLAVTTSLYVLRELLRALDHAHRARDAAGERLDVVHRDVTPSNVLLSFDGDVKLCDFGIASARCMPPVPEDRIEGKTGYMSPEHARGAEPDKKSDVYSVGIILWEMIAGRRMRSSKPELALAAAKRGEVPPFPLRGLPEEARLHGIVCRALAERRRDRYASAGAMLRELDDYCARSGFELTATDLASWLQAALAPEHAEADLRRMRALELAHSSGDHEIEESGPRLVRRRPPASEPSALGRGAHALVTLAAAAFFVVCLLVALGVL
jgi:serine/threonine protein kinase